MSAKRDETVAEERGRTMSATHNLNHLHLHVRDVERSQRFYEHHFGLREHVRHGEIVFLCDDRGFDLALAPDADPAALPAWFHFGFRLDRKEAVRDSHRRMAEAGVALTRPLLDEPGYITFQCADPDGYRIEVYWE
jgi:catechol 2,3-dioxygenase-like lactoylglutathione lyase family enzyme